MKIYISLVCLIVVVLLVVNVNKSGRESVGVVRISKTGIKICYIAKGIAVMDSGDFSLVSAENQGYTPFLPDWSTGDSIRLLFDRLERYYYHAELDLWVFRYQDEMFLTKYILLNRSGLKSDIPNSKIVAETQKYSLDFSSIELMPIAQLFEKKEVPK